MNILQKLYFKTLGQILECASLYKLSLEGKPPYEEKSLQGYSFRLLTLEDEALIRRFYADRNTTYLEAILKRLSEPGRFLCFGYIDNDTGAIAYTRWACRKHFYNDALRMDIVMQDDEVLTLDSYTHPDYRMKGLHRAMNIHMLNWLMTELKMRHVYMAIRCFLPHLTKIPKQLGYKKIKTVIFFKRAK